MSFSSGTFCGVVLCIQLGWPNTDYSLAHPISIGADVTIHSLSLTVHFAPGFYLIAEWNNTLSNVHVGLADCNLCILITSVSQILKVEEHKHSYTAELQVLDTTKCKAKTMRVVFQPTECPTEVSIQFEGASG